MIFFLVFSHEYIRMVYTMLSIFTSQGSDQEIPPVVGHTSAASGQEVNMIVTVQFKYVKMLCYYIVSVSIRFC